MSKEFTQMMPTPNSTAAYAPEIIADLDIEISAMVKRIAAEPGDRRLANRMKNLVTVRAAWENVK